MARGERDRTERTSEERERARAERERRRAERAGVPVPPEPPATESDPEASVDGVPAAGPPDAEAEPEAIGPSAPLEASEPPEPSPPVEVEPEPAAAEPEGAAVPPEPVARDPEPVVPDPEPVAHDPDPGAPETEPVAHDPKQVAPEHEPATHNPGSPAAPGPEEAAAAPHDPAAFAAEAAPEPAAHDPDLGADDPGLAAHDQDLGADDLEPTAHDAEPVAPEHYEPVAQDTDDPDPPAGHTDEQPPAEDAAGYPIPGLPASPEPAPREALPEPPPRLRASDAAPMRRAFRRDGPGAGGAGAAAGLASDGRDARGSRRRSRWIAVLALLVIGVVVALLVYGLSRSSDHTTAKAPPVVKVLIPEGKTRLQIAQIAQAAGLKGSYRVAARSSPLLNPTQYGAPHGTSTLEGFLFPATYDMNKGAPSARLVEEQLQAFQENFTAEYAKRARELGLTPYELLTVASMIEREAQVPSDRAKIAAVIYNRLKAGIPLGIDATIYYAVETAHNIPTYTKELTTSQLEADSAYNTRLHKGLPPTPISNPGVESIQAAAHPAHVSYLYYVAGADGCGEQRFATTEAKFNEDVAAYEAAKRANGGHLPACKKH